VCAEKGLVTLAKSIAGASASASTTPDGHTGEVECLQAHALARPSAIRHDDVLMSSARSITWQAVPRSTQNGWASFGMSMGSTKAWWLAALEPRVKVCMDVCCLTDFDELIKTHGLKGHGIFYYVPSLLKNTSRRRR